MESSLLNFIIEVYNWYFMKYDNPPLKSDLVNWTAYFKINNQMSSKEVNAFVKTYLNSNSSIKANKTNFSKIDELLYRSFGQVVFVHQLHHIYCELFELEVDTSHEKCVNYFLGNDIQSIESDFKDCLQYKYGMSSGCSQNIAKNLTIHEFKTLPSYAECIKEVESIIDANFKFNQFA
jgi:hypothetical protein